jgi:hypothetical protein
VLQGTKNVSLDKTLKVSHALDGDGMNRPSWGKDMVTVQDAYNCSASSLGTRGSFSPCRTSSGACSFRMYFIGELFS